MKIEVLYPEICNLYGDLGNIRYLQISSPGRNCSCWSRR